MKFNNTPYKEIRYNNWRILFNDSGELQTETQDDFKTLFQQMQNPQQVLKHDHRSEVGIFTVDNTPFIVKKFTIQDSWLWFQLTSILFPTVGEIAFRNGVDLSEAGLLTPRPTLLVQCEKNGMITKSWLAYRFMEGDLLNNDDVQEIVTFIKQMHRLGWVHRDPHPANFLRTSEGIATIDPIKARRRRNPYMKAYDVVLLSHDMPSAPMLYGLDELGIWWGLAKFGHQTIRNYRNIKQQVRKKLGLSGSGRKN